MNRNTTLRDKHRAIIAKDKPGCYLEEHGRCLFPGEPINYEADWRDPLSFTIEHKTPLARGGTDTLDNIGPAHRACNRDKGTKPLVAAGVTFITERTW